MKQFPPLFTFIHGIQDDENPLEPTKNNLKKFQEVRNGRLAPLTMSLNEEFGDKGRPPTKAGNYPAEKWLSFFLGILVAVIKGIFLVLVAAAEFLNLLNEVRCKNCLSTPWDTM